MKTYNVCWTGGVDSTFIVTQLSQFPVTIQPFYIKGQTFSFVGTAGDKSDYRNKGTFTEGFTY